MNQRNEEVEPNSGRAEIERQEQPVTPSGLYTDEPWALVAPFGSEWKTIIKSHDPRVYPENESITVALVDPASEVPVEVAEANARLIAAAPLLHEAARFARSVLAANPMELSERMAIEKLDAALALADMPVESAKRPISDHSTDG